MNRVPRWAWGLWAALSVGAFALLEGFAIVDHTPNDTLTWTIIGAVPAGVFFGGFVAFVAWFGVHMLKRYRSRHGGL